MGSGTAPGRPDCGLVAQSGTDPGLETGLRLQEKKRKMRIENCACGVSLFGDAFSKKNLKRRRRGVAVMGLGCKRVWVALWMCYFCGTNKYFLNNQ
jgi:hypothetical protein